MLERAWWEKTPDSYHFYDGDDDPSLSTVGPELLHFQSTSLKQVYMQKQLTWEKIVNNNTELPPPRIQLYNESGEPTGFIHYTHTLLENQVETQYNSDSL